MRTHLFLWLFLWQMTSLLMAQTAIRGTVLDDSSGQPIESVQVFLYRTDSIQIASDYTTANGEFSLHYDSGKGTPFYLLAICMGYKKGYSHVTAVHQTIELRLKPSQFQLKEVNFVVPRVQQKSDTIVYDVSSFASAEDKSISDVIAKMPGLEVSNNGELRYQGKSINRLYIEGMNLLDGKYSQATENLDRKKVKQIEVWRNHQPVRMLITQGTVSQRILIIQADLGARHDAASDIAHRLQQQP